MLLGGVTTEVLRNRNVEPGGVPVEKRPTFDRSVSMGVEENWRGRIHGDGDRMLI